jgi:hypothetical protein
MARIHQVGIGRKSSGTIDGITYVTRNGVTYARATPVMPASVYKTPAALKRQAIFKMVQMHLKYRLVTIRQTFTPSINSTAKNCYYKRNGKALTAALTPLAERYVAGEQVTIDDVEEAICSYAAEHPRTICIASLNGYQEVFLSGEWPSTINLHFGTNAPSSTVVLNPNDSTTSSETGE